MDGLRWFLWQAKQEMGVRLGEGVGGREFGRGSWRGARLGEGVWDMAGRGLGWRTKDFESKRLAANKAQSRVFVWCLGIQRASQPRLRVLVSQKTPGPDQTEVRLAAGVGTSRSTGINGELANQTNQVTEGKETRGLGMSVDSVCLKIPRRLLSSSGMPLAALACRTSFPAATQGIYTSFSTTTITAPPN